MHTAKTWMLAHQLGRRNLTPEQVRYPRHSLTLTRDSTRESRPRLAYADRV
jgi:hypothetical protein